MRTMTPEERGIAAGYGGIWYNVENSVWNKPIPKRNWKYEMVFDYDEEDKVWDSKAMWFFPDKEKTKSKYFIDGDKLYKLVNPDGELFSWMDGNDPLA